MNTKFADVFKPGLGHCTKTKSKLFLKADARPVCRQRRPVPFASQPAVNMEIDRLPPRRQHPSPKKPTIPLASANTMSAQTTTSMFSTETSDPTTATQHTQERGQRVRQPQKRLQLNPSRKSFA
ncbi:hypothetical protein Aduo_009001 [Ancylostoma duodenale]